MWLGALCSQGHRDGAPPAARCHGGKEPAGTHCCCLSTTRGEKEGHDRSPFLRAVEFQQKLSSCCVCVRSQQCISKIRIPPFSPASVSWLLKLGFLPTICTLCCFLLGRVVCSSVLLCHPSCCTFCPPRAHTNLQRSGSQSPQQDAQIPANCSL